MKRSCINSFDLLIIYDFFSPNDHTSLEVCDCPALMDLFSSLINLGVRLWCDSASLTASGISTLNIWWKIVPTSKLWLRISVISSLIPCLGLKESYALYRCTALCRETVNIHFFCFLIYNIALSTVRIDYLFVWRKVLV